jgi:ABC-type oligopeptide transport system ATPase subunit
MAMFQTSNTGSETLIRVEGLRKYFPVRAGVLQRVDGWVQAVDDVSFTIRKGETLGMVGAVRPPSAAPCCA